MNIPIFEFIAAAFVVAVANPPLPAHAQRNFTPEFEAKVIHVDDGDTVVARQVTGDNVKVRLANIDAPETSHGRCRAGQPFSNAATVALKNLVLGETIQFKCSTLDRYGRHVCDLHLGRTTANVELAARGLAWANRARPSYLRDPNVAAAEREARAKGLGLWSNAASVPPWEWRHTKWDKGCTRI